MSSLAFKSKNLGKNKFVNQNILIEIIAALFILLFVYTALNKLLNIDTFKWSLSHSPVIGKFPTLLSIAVPLTELTISALLFVRRTRVLGMFGSLLLMVLFTGYITYLLLFEDKLPCSCGGVIQEMTWTQHMIFNCLFILLALAALWMHNKMSKTTKKNFI